MSHVVNENLTVGVGASINAIGVNAILHDGAGNGAGFNGPLPVVMVKGYTAVPVPGLFLPSLAISVVAKHFNK